MASLAGILHFLCLTVPLVSSNGLISKTYKTLRIFEFSFVLIQLWIGFAKMSIYFCFDVNVAVKLYLHIT
jgi:hypothetical protein